MAVQPLHLLLDIMEYLGPSSMAWLTKLKVLNSVLPITNILTMMQTFAQTRLSLAMINSNKDATESILLSGALFGVKFQETWATHGLTAATWQYVAACEMANLESKGMFLTMMGGLGIFLIAIQFTGMLGDALAALAGVFVLVAVFNMFKDVIKDYGKLLGPLAIPVAIAASLATLYAAVKLKRAIAGEFAGASGGAVAASGAPKSVLPTERMYDSGGMFTGGRMYDSKGPTTEHGMAILQKGETVVPKTRNMLEGGVTLNIGGDILTNDAEDFAERIADVLPMVLRRQSDIGGM